MSEQASEIDAIVRVYRRWPHVGWCRTCRAHGSHVTAQHDEFAGRALLRLSRGGGVEKPPRHRIRSHLALLDPGFACCAPDCPHCQWYRDRGGWACDDSMEEWLDGQR